MPKVTPENLGIAPGVTPQDPVITSIIFTENGSTITKNAPFVGTQNITPDLNTGTCSGTKAEVKFIGTFDSEYVASFSVTGPSTTTTTTSGNNFEITACLATGATSVTIKAINAEGTTNPVPIQISLNISNSTATYTLGYNHPKYPTPGFRVGTGRAPLPVSSSGIEMKNIVVSEAAGKINSTGNTTLTMQLGFPQIVSEVSP